MTMILIWALVGYISGSVMYSRLIAKHILNVDIYSIGDGNPGTFNVGRAGGTKWAILAFILDTLKAAIPVAIPYIALGITDWRIIPIAITPAIGHAYPLFFGFKGGKGIAAIAGGWVGLAIWEIITVGGLLLAFWYFSVKESAWAVIFMGMSIGLYLLITQVPFPWYGYWFIGMIFLLWTHRREIKNPPGVQPWVERVAGLWHSPSL